MPDVTIELPEEYGLDRSLEVTPGEDIKGDIKGYHSGYLTNFDLYSADCKQKPNTK